MVWEWDQYEPLQECLCHIAGAGEPKVGRRVAGSAYQPNLVQQRQGELVQGLENIVTSTRSNTTIWQNVSLYIEVRQSNLLYVILYVCSCMLGRSWENFELLSVWIWMFEWPQVVEATVVIVECNTCIEAVLSLSSVTFPAMPLIHWGHFASIDCWVPLLSPTSHAPNHLLYWSGRVFRDRREWLCHSVIVTVRVACTERIVNNMVTFLQAKLCMQ